MNRPLTFICSHTYTRTASVRLLIALCRERNLVSQKLVGAIVPVDAILYLLHSNALGERSGARGLLVPHHPSPLHQLSSHPQRPIHSCTAAEADKALFCDLLRTVYVEHDLVFPVSPLLPHQATCLSLDPEQVAYGEMGRVFNPLSQTTLSLAAIGSRPIDQRAGLRAFLTEHLGRLEDYAGAGTGAGAGPRSPQQQREAFAASLLRLTHGLLRQGFFEPESAGRRTMGGWAMMETGGGATSRSLGAHTAGLLTSFFGNGLRGEEDEEEQQRASEWGPPVVVEEAVAAAAAAAGASSHPRSPQGAGLLARLVSPRGLRSGAGAGAPSRPAALTYSFLEATLIVTLEAAGRATVARAKAANGGETSSLQDLQVSGGGAYSLVFDEPGPVALKAEVVGLLRTLADIRSIKNAKALLSSFRLYESQGQGQGHGPHDARHSLVMRGRDSASGGVGGASSASSSRAAIQLRFGRTQEAVLERGFDDRTQDGEVFLNAVLGATAHRDRTLLIKAYDLLYRHSTQRVAFAALLDELDVSRRPSLAITMRTQRQALELFEKHVPGFQQRAKASCDVLSYVLHLLTRLCYRNWDDAPLPLISPTATANGMPAGNRGSSVRGGGGGGVGLRLGPTATRRFRTAELNAMFASSGEDGGAAAAATAASWTGNHDPFGNGKPPYVNAEALGMEDACSQPIPAQQEELQRAARHVAVFLVRTLQSSSDVSVGKESACLDAGNDFVRLFALARGDSSSPSNQAGRAQQQRGPPSAAPGRRQQQGRAAAQEGQHPRGELHVRQHGEQLPHRGAQPDDGRHHDHPGRWW